MTPVPEHTSRLVTVRLGTAAFAYACFVVYGSLVPLDFHPRSLTHAWQAFLSIPYLHLGIASRADWVANILLYIPLAFLLTGRVTANTHSRAGAVAGSSFAVLVCVVLAFAVEFTQLFFPPRTVSQNDLIAETIGTFLGAGIWLAAGLQLISLWREFWHGGLASVRALVLLYLVAYLALSLFPYDFVITPAELSEKMLGSRNAAVIFAASCGSGLQCGVKLLAEVIAAVPLGILLGIAGIRGTRIGLGRAFGAGALLGFVVEGLQFFLASGVTQGISILTRGIGAASGLAFQRGFRLEWLSQHRGQVRMAIVLAIPVYLVLVFGVSGLLSGHWEPTWTAWEKLQKTHFLPFYYHYYTTETVALFSALTIAGMYAPLGFALWLISQGGGRRYSPWPAALVALLTAFCVEALKLFINGRKPDPTNVLIAAASAWTVYVVLAHLERTRAAERMTSAPPVPPLRLQPSRRIQIAGLVGLACLALAGWIIASPTRERLVDESTLPRLPPGDTLPLPVLAGFRQSHPRLPHPAPEEIELLRRFNPDFLRQQQELAAGGDGGLGLESAVLMEYTRRGSQDLALLHQRLMGLKFAGRGHDQVKPLALAYDWLYANWNPMQRAQLRAKLSDGCDYVIGVIRSERQSPYNVFLYNSPLQALMACAIALYRDDPRAEPMMAFTYDLWEKRVLPVWRQVMGKNGGWHEGGEYVGIGVGQAVYEVPAMWREATGEDVFASEPGIRGFLDFLIYRTRPDGTYFRWGDGAFFDRAAPDGLPLAIHYHNAAAYTLLGPPQALVPTAWPWGPLTDASLRDPTAVSRLPLTRLFDGIGLVVARSDWSPDATYVTFKAGDNFWSHSHLDQGAFTIYKGGALAIDSGLYGPRYGADHHMNYTYQTIAHNTITVTDPEDTVAGPGKKQPRPIANDGGQRRIGSGWGVEGAPLDRYEWDAKREIYHTGSIEKLFDQDGLTVAIADITPAYTNGSSGAGTFSARTRRVERFWRVFGYDRVNDVVVVYDDVRATQASFRKRWLLHTQQAPAVSGNRFDVTIPPADHEGRSGGRLEGHVLFPEHPVINAIGGRGLEFFVDDRNFDEDGKIWDYVRTRGPLGPEPGAWRIEVSPDRDAQDDQFLVVLFPSKLGDVPNHVVRSLQSGGRIGCEIAGAGRITRWWFEAGRQGVTVDVVEGSVTRSFQLLGATATTSTTQHAAWVDALRRWLPVAP